jgi:hypothetical protein
MLTIGWNDIARAKAPGSVTFRQYSLAIGEADIARWEDDPDGRFKLVTSDDPATARLGTFYPSL